MKQMEQFEVVQLLCLFTMECNVVGLETRGAAMQSNAV
jgi:hypothetical protein